MAIEWIKPKGKTQPELDAEKTAAEREKLSEAARIYLRDTDYQIIKAAEAFLNEQGLIDSKIASARTDARMRIADSANE